MQARVMTIEQVCFNVDIGGSTNLILQASGMVNSSGWNNPQLTAYAYVHPPEDGIQDFDFVAEPPTGIVLWVNTPVSAVFRMPIESWMQGVRVHAARNTIEAMFSDDDCKVRSSVLDPDDPTPWPWGVVA